MLVRSTADCKDSGAEVPRFFGASGRNQLSRNWQPRRRERRRVRHSTPKTRGPRRPRGWEPRSLLAAPLETNGQMILITLAAPATKCETCSKNRQPARPSVHPNLYSEQAHRAPHASPPGAAAPTPSPPAPARDSGIAPAAARTAPVASDLSPPFFRKSKAWESQSSCQQFKE